MIWYDGNPCPIDNLGGWKFLCNLHQLTNPTPFQLPSSKIETNESPIENLAKTLDVNLNDLQLYLKQITKPNKLAVGQMLNKAIKIFVTSEALTASKLCADSATDTVEIATEIAENDNQWQIPN